MLAHVHDVTTVHPDHLASQLRTGGWAIVMPADLLGWLGTTALDLAPLAASWNDLTPDAHLRDGGHYRLRRHGSFLVDPVEADLVRVPHRAHWQPVTYNALHGGMERWFAPILPGVAEHPLWARLLVKLGVELARLTPVPRWYVEAHQFRIDTTGGIGRPTPEGAHRDGVDYVVILMIRRHHIMGAETRVFEADGPHGMRFTLDEPWSTLVLDDARVIHESTPIRPLFENGYRDTLVLTYRAGGFQSPGSG
jgi:hypothetical protein